MSTPFSIGASVWPGLSKLIEEAGEVQQVCGKLVQTGGASAHWDGSDLRKRLEEEIADLLAACRFVMESNDLNVADIVFRSLDKLAMFKRWHEENLTRTKTEPE